MRKLTTEEFIEKAKKIHNNLYDYSLSLYKDSRTKVNINCSIHGIFSQTGNAHLTGQGCPKCGTINAHKKISHNNESFINKAKKIHGDRYDYSKVNYVNNHTSVEIVCKIHGTFNQVPNIHLNKKGCPNCSTSKGEGEIKKILEKNGLKYKIQHVFKDCFYKQPLRFDFYLPEFNTCIEYDGIQHFIPIEYFGGIKNLGENRVKDNIKNEYCFNNKIRLIRVKYSDKINYEKLILSHLF
jgi:hypothetical protein